MFGYQGNAKGGPGIMMQGIMMQMTWGALGVVAEVSPDNVRFKAVQEQLNEPLKH